MGDAFRLLSANLRTDSISKLRAVVAHWKLFAKKTSIKQSQTENMIRLVGAGVRLSRLLELGVVVSSWRQLVALHRSGDAIKRAALKVDQVIVDKDNMRAEMMEQVKQDLERAYDEKISESTLLSLKHQRGKARRDAQIANILQTWY